MGIYHFTGLGKLPGAVTSPLTVIYILLKSAEIGNPRAKDFFQYSGESGHSMKGVPECLVIFTSKGIINGMKPPTQVRSQLLPNKKFSGSVLSIMHDYLSSITEALALNYVYKYGYIKKIYLIEVEYQNFDDCYPKANTFLYVYRDKECWINAQAGSNQINTALIISGSINLISWKYYYVKQATTELLDIYFLKPDALKNPDQYVDKLLEVWGELHVFGLGINEVIRNLVDEFSSREKINISELKRMLKEHGLGSIFLKYSGDSVSKSDQFDTFTQTFSNKWANLNNSSEVLAKAREKGILYELGISTGKVLRP
ncbi:MAG: hypothetical protein QXO01_05195 [Nitrososphaerota archaeon]